MVNPNLTQFWRIRRQQRREPCVIRPFHKQIARSLTDIVNGTTLGNKPNLMILMPPRCAKTDLGVRTFIPWALSYYPDSEFITSSYGADLAIDSTIDIRQTLASEWYRSMVSSDWGANVEMRGEQAGGRQDFFLTKEGGSVKAIGRGGGITGFGAGKLRDEFGGAIVCFPPDEYVWTEKGKIKISEIVDNKLPLKVFSKNLLNDEIEKQPIIGWYKNPGSDIIQVFFKGGHSIKCTPEHKIYTNNRGYVPAKNLLSTDHVSILPPYTANYCSVNIEFSSNSSEWFKRITYFLNLIIRKIYNFSFPGGQLSSFSRYRFPCFAGFNLTNNSCANPILFRQDSCGNRTSSNLDSLKARKLCSGTFFQKRKSFMSFSIINILGARSIKKIIKSIIGRIAIIMTGFLTFFFWTKKRQSHCNMNKDAEMFSINASTLTKMAKHHFERLEDFFRQFIRWLIRSCNNSSITSNSTKIRNAVPSVSRYLSPLFIRYHNYSSSTYCLNVRCNHNFYVGKSQAILVSNCDDMLKAQEARSAAARKDAVSYYTGTLKTRRNRNDAPKTPIILIMQRLHPEDLAGYILREEREEWNVLQIEAHNETETCWPGRIGMEEMMFMKIQQPDDYWAQYMQNPKAGTSTILKREYWRYWRDVTKVEKLITLKIITADTAFKTADVNDWSVFQCWGLCPGGMFLIDQVRKRLEFPELMKTAKDFWIKHSRRTSAHITPATEFWVEDKASGQSLVQTLRKEGIPARGWNPDESMKARPNKATVAVSVMASKDKVGRANQCTMPLSAGRIFIPDPNMPDYAWVEGFIAEHESFTTDDSHLFDDQVDTFTEACLIWQARGGGSGNIPVLQ